MSEVYILTDNQNCIIGLDGGYSISNVDVETWTLIDEGEGDRYNLCQSHYLDRPLYEEHGIPRYKYVHGEIVERTQEEINAEITPSFPEPSLESRIDDLEIAICELFENLM